MRTTSLVVAALSAAWAGSAASAAPQYIVKDLGTFGGSYGSQAYALNDSGQVVGTASAPDGTSHAFRSAPEGGALTDLGLHGGIYQSVATAINNAGQVAGYADNGVQGSGNGPVAFDASGHAPVDPNSGDSEAWGLNSSGQLVGDMFIFGANEHESAFRAITGGSANAMATFGGSNGSAQGVNSIGQIVGYADTADFRTHAFRTDAAGSLTDLGTYDDTNSFGLAINESGQVAGYANTNGNPTYPAYHAMRIDGPGAFTDLGTLGGSESWGQGINDAGIIVGRSLLDGDATAHAFIADGSGITDLNSLIPANSGWTLVQANDINNLSQIVGYGTIGGQTHAFYLTPVPEPASLSAAGIVALGMLGRRPRTR